ncbi:MAG: SH3 domain-containing protein [Saccharofermentans sp.]|jgi:hypothetical protein|nr:SH3 domain-containing protein [Saccharofermentans sp.]MCI1768866.1 SH3 domain-containing protein [Mageeibacillus sp.]
MKKRESTERLGARLFERGKAKKQIIGDNIAEKKVRHLENPVKLPFLNDMDATGDEEYGRTEDMKDEWGLTRNEATLRQKRRRSLLRLGVASGVFILILLGIFYILPRVLPSFFEGTSIQLFVQPEVNLEYTDPAYRVITESSVGVMQLPSEASERITEVLYNEPVTVTSDAVDGFVKIKTTDGIEGYIPVSSFTASTDSVEPDLHEYKLVVSDPSKNIMTHASNGTVMKRVVMNTVLFADVKREGVYQVYLPGGESGWISSSGVIELGTRENTQEVSCRYFVSSLLTFVNTEYKENGLSMYGSSVNGAVYVCSEINGITMPRTMQEQSQLGDEVVLDHDAVTGDVIIEGILPGDILFLRSPTSEEGDTHIYEAAVCTDTGTLLMLSSARTTIRLRTFKAGDSICNRIITIRRIFKTE